MTKQPAKTEPFLTKEYKGLLKEIKEKVQSSQLKAAVAVNTELVKLYWEIGRSVHERQKSEGWGAKTLETLANDLKSAFPQMKGFSPRNLQYMVTFAREYSEDTITQQLVAQIPWGHNTLLLDKIKDRDTRVWYIKKTIEKGWSRSVLLHWIDSGLHDRQGRALNNFERTLVAAQSDLAQETLKDPYNFDFLTLREQFDERELEDGLIDHVQKFLLELGTGFAFVGKQYPIKAGKKDLYIDLLFYHLKLRCYFIVELKAREFDSRDAGQMSAYLSAVDDLLRHEGDNPSIGMILCKTKDNVFVEYVLRNFNRPIGVAEYETKIIESLPDDLKGSLPTIEEIEHELEGNTE